MRDSISNRQISEYFTRLSIETFCVPVIDTITIDPRGNKELLEVFEKEMGEFAGIIFSSKNGVRSFFETLSYLEIKKKFPVCFAIGAGTAASIPPSLISEIHTCDTKCDADTLADSIVSYHKQNQLNGKTWLFVCGDKRRDVIPNRLKEAGVGYRELVTYKTINSSFDILNQSLLDIKSKCHHEPIFVLFSPSGVDSCLQPILTLFNEPKFVCIGKTTASHLRSQLLLLLQSKIKKVDIQVADLPTAEGLLNAICCYRF